MGTCVYQPQNSLHGFDPNSGEDPVYQKFRTKVYPSIPNTMLVLERSLLKATDMVEGTYQTKKKIPATVEAPIESLANTTQVAGKIFPKMTEDEEEISEVVEDPIDTEEEVSEVIDVEISPSKEPLDVLEGELSKLTEMLKDPNCDIRLLIDQFCRISMVIHRQGALDSKLYALDKELELSVEITKVQNTYNNWKTLTITIVSGGLTIAGGVVGFAGAFPGSDIGKAMADVAPNLLSLFATKDAAKTLGALSKGLGGVGQGSGAFGSIFSNQAEAERALHQFILNQGQNALGEKNQATSSERQLSREAIRKSAENDSEARQTIRLILDTK